MNSLFLRKITPQSSPFPWVQLLRKLPLSTFRRFPTSQATQFLFPAAILQRFLPKMKRYLNTYLHTDIRNSVEHFNVLIDGYCRNGEIIRAVELLEGMKTNGPAPDIVTYNTLINGFCKFGDVFTARKLTGEIFFGEFGT